MNASLPSSNPRGNACAFTWTHTKASPRGLGDRGGDGVSAILYPRQKGPWPKILHTISTYLVLIVRGSSRVALPQKSLQRGSWDSASKKHGMAMEGDPGTGGGDARRGDGIQRELSEDWRQEAPLLMKDHAEPAERLL